MPNIPKSMFRWFCTLSGGILKTTGKCHVSDRLRTALIYYCYNNLIFTFVSKFKIEMLSHFLSSSLDLNAAESGVQHKPATPRNPLNTDQTPNKESCAC